MKILFLDFDGVLNSHQYYLMFGEKSEEIFDSTSLNFRFCSYNVWNLDFILKNVPELKVVIHSSVRKYFSLLQIREALSKFSANTDRLIAFTDPHRGRKDSIDSYIKENPVTNFLILDDYNVDPQNQILVHPMTGLTYIDACNTIFKFNPEFKQPVLLF